MDDLLIYIKKIHWSEDQLLSKFEMTEIKHLKFRQGLESREGLWVFCSQELHAIKVLWCESTD